MSNNEWWMRELYGREKIALPNGKRIRLIKELIECGALDEIFLRKYYQSTLMRVCNGIYNYGIFITKSFYSS